jgi:hypothetical protein
MKTIISRAITVMAISVVVINCWLVYKIIALSDTPTNDDMRTFAWLLDEIDQDKQRESINRYNHCKDASTKSNRREHVLRAISQMDQILAVQDSALSILEKIRLSANNPKEAENHFTNYRKLILRNKNTITLQSQVKIDWYFINGEKLLTKSILPPSPNLIVLKTLALRSDLLYSMNNLLRHLCSG